jgi:signal transduction histidine kinase/ligand-binding sensor domain-containing protein/CheY-like chemotaxis protein
MKLKILLAILAFQWLHSNSQSLRFNKITSNDGLSQSEVYSFLKDRQGFIWIGTIDGLNRYDGYKISKYNVGLDQNTSLSNNTIHSLVEDFNGRIWIGTDDELNVLNAENQRLFKIKLPITSKIFVKIFHLFVDKTLLWISTNQGLFLADISSDNFNVIEKNIINIGKLGNNSIENEYIYRTIKLSNGIYCCALPNSILSFHFDKSKKKFNPIQLSPYFSSLGASHIIEDKNGNLWISNINIPESGLFRFNNERAELTHFTKENSTLSSNRISSMALDTTGNIWLGTIDNGLIRIKAENVSSKKFPTEIFKNNIFDPKSINSNLIYSLYASADNQLWVGTIGSGVNFLNLKQKNFNHYVIPPFDNEKSIHSNFIRSVFLDNNNCLWIGTHNNGLFLLNRRTNQYKKVGFDTQIVFHIEWFDSNSLFVSTSTGTYLVSLDGRITPVGDINRACFYSRKVSPNTIFVGGILGLYRLQFNNNKVVRTDRYDSKSSNIKISYDNCRILHHDKLRNQLWVGTEGGGLNILSLNAAFEPIKCEVYKKENHAISSNYIRSICQTDENTFWIGTHLGLNRCFYNSGREKIAFKGYFLADGLPNNMIQSITIDNNQTLWIGSNLGLTRFDTKKNKMTSYTSADGLQSNEFSEHASFKAPNGELFLGGINGVNSFYPENIKSNNLNPLVTLTDFYLFNEKVTPQTNIKGRILLENPIFMTDKIWLKAKENNFRFDFSSMNFQAPEKIKYAYMLEGYDKKWNTTESGSHTATYTNLEHGSYIFRVKATNDEGVWSKNERIILIDIATPFYLSWFAFLFYITAAGLIIFYFTRYSMIKIATKQQIIFDADHNQRLHELDMIRTRFFINISHDLRTPLTLIAGPLEQILKTENYPEGLKKQLSMVHRNATKLKYLIEQLLDFRKVEVGKLEASFRKVELNQFVKNEIDHFDFILKDKGLDLIYDFKQDNIYTNIDTEKTAKVIFNLLSNAVKFTKQGYIEISVDTCEKGSPLKQFTLISVKDTGKGIESTKIGRIFDRFYNDSQSATDSSYGIGLSHCKDLIEVMNGEITVQSDWGNGSTFTFFLPMEFESQENIDEVVTEQVCSSPLGIKSEIINDSTELKPHKLQTILIAEDNPEMREYIKSCLINDYNIIEAENGAEGYEKSIKKMPDLIVSDYVMPIMDGIEFCEKIKTTLETSHIPVILLTARTDNEIKFKGLEIGADDYISKPFETDYLLVKIKSLIKNRDNLRQLFQNNIIFEPSKVTVTSTDEKFLNDLMNEIEKGIPESEYSVDTLEKAMAMSHAKFYNKVKNLTGLSGKELLQDFRLKRAAQIITENDVTVADVCYMVGFSDPKYFSACFKAKFKVTPTEYRLQN